MPRLLLALVASAACLMPAPAAPALKDRKDQAPYAPTQVGDTRVYELHSAGGAVTEHTDTVTGVDKVAGGLRVTIGRVLAGETPVWTVFEVSDAGVVWLTRRGEKLPHPVPALKRPVKPGQTWEEQPNPAGPKTTYTAGPEEEVEVPAGKFKAVRVESEMDAGAGPYRQTYWHAPRVGIVKVVTRSGASEYSQVLKTFTPGKK